MPVTTTVDVSVVAVVLATVGYQVLGALWYGPLFGARWMDAMGYGDDDEVAGDATAGYVMTTVGSLVAVVTLGVLID